MLAAAAAESAASSAELIFLAARIIIGLEITLHAAIADEKWCSYL